MFVSCCCVVDVAVDVFFDDVAIVDVVVAAVSSVAAVSAAFGNCKNSEPGTKQL